MSDIADEKRDAFFAAFGFGVFAQFFRLGGETDAIGRVGKCGDRGENIRIFGKFQYRCLAVTVFFDFLSAGIGDAPVRDGCDGNEDVLFADM